MGYKVGQKPLGLQKDGTFEVFGLRVDATISDDGEVLCVDKKTGCLVVDEESPGCQEA